MNDPEFIKEILGELKINDPEEALKKWEEEKKKKEEEDNKKNDK